MPFPTHRLRRLRTTGRLRDLVRETRLHPAQFILPLFVCPGEGVRREIGAMPGNYQLSIDELAKECAEALSLGIGGVMLFGLPESKDEIASGAYDENGIVQRAVRALDVTGVAELQPGMDAVISLPERHRQFGPIADTTPGGEGRAEHADRCEVARDGARDPAVGHLKGRSRVDQVQNGVLDPGALRRPHLGKPSIGRAEAAGAEGIVAARIEDHHVEPRARTLHLPQHEIDIHHLEIDVGFAGRVGADRHQIVRAVYLYAVAA